MLLPTRYSPRLRGCCVPPYVGHHTYYMQQHVSDYLGTISSSVSSPSDDDSRVHLAQIPGVEGSDYINANFIDVSSAVHVSNAFDSSSRAQYLPLSLTWPLFICSSLFACRVTRRRMRSLRRRVLCQTPRLTSGGWCGSTDAVVSSCSPMLWRRAG